MGIRRELFVSNFALAELENAHIVHAAAAAGAAVGIAMTLA